MTGQRTVTIGNYYDRSSTVQAIVDFCDATHLLTPNPAQLEQRLAKQLVFFLSSTVARIHRSTILPKHLQQLLPFMMLSFPARREHSVFKAQSIF
jgi:hypothetical protein